MLPTVDIVSPAGDPAGTGYELTSPALYAIYTDLPLGVIVRQLGCPIALREMVVIAPGLLIGIIYKFLLPAPVT
jgi:hypothetical protein